MKKEKHEEAIFVQANSILAILNAEQMQEVLQGDYEDAMERNKDSHEVYFMKYSFKFNFKKELAGQR